MTKVSIEKIRRFLNRKFSQEPFEEEINMTWGEKHWKAVQFSYILPAQPTPDFNLLFAWECNKGGEKKYSNEVEEEEAWHGIRPSTSSKMWLWNTWRCPLHKSQIQISRWPTDTLQIKLGISTFFTGHSFSVANIKSGASGPQHQAQFLMQWTMKIFVISPIHRREWRMYQGEVRGGQGGRHYCLPYLLSITRLAQDKTRRPQDRKVAKIPDTSLYEI